MAEFSIWRTERNPKSETRNPKQIRNPKFPNPKLPVIRFEFAISVFEFVSNFVLRISSLNRQGIAALAA
jgi:hypothetical protein